MERVAFIVLGVLALSSIWSGQAASSDETSPENSQHSLVKCNFTETKGTVCQDCNTRLTCTPLGIGLIRPCWWPGLENCVNGRCVAEPSSECTPTESTTTAATSPELN